MDHVNTPINEIVVMYQKLSKSSDHQHRLTFLYPRASCHVFLFFSVSRFAEALCQKTIQLLVSDMLACTRVRTWIPVEWPTSLGVILFTY
jgi:hypothetical protein